jgi:hypothetical protein
MAFNHLVPAEGPFILSAGSQIGVNVTYPNFEDMGAQWIMADPIGPGQFTVTDMTKERRIAIPNRLHVVYGVTVKCTGSDGLFSVQGGGNV